MAVEIAPIPTSALPMAALRDHLRLGTGFADDGLLDPLIEAALRAALAQVEARCGRAVLSRAFTWQMPGWQLPAMLPMGGVTAVTAVEIVDAAGDAVAVGDDRWVLIPDPAFPELAGVLPPVRRGGFVRVTFETGFEGWDTVPADLRLAILMLAGRFYEDRGEGQRLPEEIAGLIAPWRRVRIGGAA